MRGFGTTELYATRSTRWDFHRARTAMSSPPGPWSPPTRVGELAGDPLSRVADRAVQGAFGRTWEGPPPDDRPPRRPVEKVDRAGVGRLLADGEPRRARIVGVRETHRSIAYGTSGAGSWECPRLMAPIPHGGDFTVVGCISQPIPITELDLVFRTPVGTPIDLDNFRNSSST